MKVILEIEYPNDKIFKANTLPIRIVDLNYGIYFDGKAKIVQAIPIEWIEKQRVDFENEDHPFNYCRGFQDGYNDCIDYLIDEWKEENEQTN